MKKLMAVLDLLRPGRVVANPELWKHGGAALQAALVPFLVAVVSALCTLGGICLKLTPEVAAAIAGGVVAVVGVFVTYVSSDKVGLLPAKPASTGVAGAAGDAAAGGDAHAAAPMGSSAAVPPAPRPVRPVDDGTADANGNLRAGG